MTVLTEVGRAREVRADPGRGSRSPRAARPSFLMSMPALAFFTFFAIVPLIGVVLLSFMEWDGLGTPVWVGTANWSRVLVGPSHTTTR